MLKELFVSNYALIDDLKIDFSTGFTVVTGETGSGKSILLGALGLVTGDRADKSVMRISDKKLIVEATFDIHKYKLQSVFSEVDIDYWEETIIRREILPSGKSRSFVNDTPIKLTDLKKITSQLIHIHAQNETHLLLDPNNQLQFLDDFIDEPKLYSDFNKKYSDWLVAKQEKEKWLSEYESAMQKLDYLTFQCHEIEKSGVLNESESIDSLENELSKVENAESLLENIHTVIELFSNDESGVQSQLKIINSSIRKIASHDQSAEEILERIQSVSIEIDDIFQTIEEKQDEFDFKPEALFELKEKVNAYNALAQKYAVSGIEEIQALYTEVKTKIDQISSGDEQLESLKKIEKEKFELAYQVAQNIRQKRIEASKKIGVFIKEKLPSLSMEFAQINVEFEDVDLSKNGIDKIRFQLSANKGSSFQAIDKVASGGELSRVMLVLQWFWAMNKKLPTVIFDEIDTGVSGKVAEAMGNIMKSLSEYMQVFAITHLPQVASKGNEHLLVEKYSSDKYTYSIVKKLDKEKRLQALAQMLSGDIVTVEAQENARKMLG